MNPRRTTTLKELPGPCRRKNDQGSAQQLLECFHWRRRIFDILLFFTSSGQRSINIRPAVASFKYLFNIGARFRAVVSCVSGRHVKRSFGVSRWHVKRLIREFQWHVERSIRQFQWHVKRSFRVLQRHVDLRVRPKSPHNKRAKKEARKSAAAHLRPDRRSWGRSRGYSGRRSPCKRWRADRNDRARFPPTSRHRWELWKHQNWCRKDRCRDDHRSCESCRTQKSRDFVDSDETRRTSFGDRERLGWGRFSGGSWDGTRMVLRLSSVNFKTEVLLTRSLPFMSVLKCYVLHLPLK